MKIHRSYRSSALEYNRTHEEFHRGNLPAYFSLISDHSRARAFFGAGIRCAANQTNRPVSYLVPKRRSDQIPPAG